MYARSRRHAAAHRMGRAWILAAVVVAMACGDVTAPTASEEPEAPPLSLAAPPPPGQTEPLYRHDYAAGVYDLAALITRFDPVWGYDLSGYRYTAVLTLSGGAPPALAGSLTDLWLIGPTGDSLLIADTGSVVSYSGFRGRDVIELRRGGISRFELSLIVATVIPGRVSGTWGCCGHISGPFEARVR